ncbi:hypothetical protein GGTG_09163 [Gaeumannomyces tritici R3-111a-1]|uniref:Cytochrome P450 n=1 Tax=Gaeumannomyces tritici (strain R3-111a-1) TaxID=644352 RepID=J3P6M1_GAET3|nr:hypothetical protein GGTG_09163 [Gaeumannomyces tritici R3-111a-1]EJT72297.1 hypothetical protein GGTG_09163 [Gaeumannomyces tritici R3-111a-1]
MGLDLQFLPLQGGGPSTTAAGFCILLLFVAGVTRLRTDWAARSQARHKTHGASKATTPTTEPVPLIPYWFPILGHIPNLAFGHCSFLTGLRDSLPDGVASLNLFGTTHVFIFRHRVGTSLLGKPSSAADTGWIRARLLDKAFGYPPEELGAYAELSPRLSDVFTRTLLSGPGLTRMVEATAGRLARNIDRFVTLGATQQAMLMPWERVAGLEHVSSPGAATYKAAANQPYRSCTDQDGQTGQSVEASLDELVRAFVGYTANPSLLGDDFMENFPHFWDLLQEFDRSWVLLGLGIPRWVPSFLAPAVARAAAAQAELLRCMREFEAALDRRAAGQDAGPRWRRLDTVSDLVQARVELYRDMGVSIEARAANELALAWAMNTNSNMLVFWVVARVAADPALLAGVRAEVAPHLKFGGGGGDAPPSSSSNGGPGAALAVGGGRIDVEGLCSRCPLLKAAYVESLRIDGSAWGFRQAREDLVLTDQRREGRPAAQWRVPKGAYAHVVEEMHNTDPRIFPNPFAWDHRRHITVQEAVGSMSAGADAHAGKEKVAVAKLGLVRPYGGGSSACPGRVFALRETMAFAAAVLHQYDIQPVNTDSDGSWVMPVTEASTVGMKRLKEPFKVVIRRRI